MGVLGAIGALELPSLPSPASAPPQMLQARSRWVCTMRGVSPPTSSRMHHLQLVDVLAVVAPPRALAALPALRRAGRLTAFDCLACMPAEAVAQTASASPLPALTALTWATCTITASHSGSIRASRRPRPALAISSCTIRCHAAVLSVRYAVGIGAAMEVRS